MTPKQVDELEAYIRSFKQGARVIQTQYAQVPLPLILNVNFNESSLYQSITSAAHHLEQEHHEHHSHHLENDGFMAVSFEIDRPLNLSKFQIFIDNLSPNIYRAKGILWFQGSQLRHVFQLTGKRCDLKSERSHLPSCNQLVFIGRTLNADAIRQQLAECIAR
ncbi:GTP-binding protein [Allocoleopsis franciscana]|uniref:GTP-binding protein n=1 Tax=Allocoleopsis franciscana TaxID=2886352 RepID=UPI0002F59409|nr:GTP-binding protein [Allocoleopsis franciscana]